jgi:hypothetical protein
MGWEINACNDSQVIEKEWDFSLSNKIRQMTSEDLVTRSTTTFKVLFIRNWYLGAKLIACCSSSFLRPFWLMRRKLQTWKGRWGRFWRFASWLLEEEGLKVSYWETMLFAYKSCLALMVLINAAIVYDGRKLWCFCFQTSLCWLLTLWQ